MKVIEFQLDNLNYDELKKLEPQEDCEVSIFNKDTGTYENKRIFCKYKSFGISPAFKETGKSFMFNHQTLTVPDELKSYLAFAQSINAGYNNCYVNW